MDKAESLAKTVFDRVASVTIENQDLRRRLAAIRRLAAKGKASANSDGAVAWRDALDAIYPLTVIKK